MTYFVEAKRALLPALLRGWKQKCPACGQGAIFGKFLKTTHVCAHCGLEIDGHRVDDAPPYFTIMIIGHIVIPGLLLMEKTWAPPQWIHLSIWLPFTIVSSLWLLPRIKGALIGLQWSRYMHGFGEDFD